MSCVCAHPRLSARSDFAIESEENKFLDRFRYHIEFPYTGPDWLQATVRGPPIVADPRAEKPARPPAHARVGCICTGAPPLHLHGGAGRVHGVRGAGAGGGRCPPPADGQRDVSYCLLCQRCINLSGMHSIRDASCLVPPPRRLLLFAFSQRDFWAKSGSGFLETALLFILFLLFLFVCLCFL